MSSENEPIRASRLSNREVMLSAAVLHNMNVPSSSTSGDYFNSNRMSSVSYNGGQQSYGRTASETSTSVAATTMTTTTATSMTSVKPNQASNCVSSTSKSSVDDTDTNSNDNDDDMSISQYELDIVNKYLNELCSSDESNDQEKSISENVDEQLTNVMKNQTFHVSCSDDDESLPNQMHRFSDQCTDQSSTLDLLSIESESESQTRQSLYQSQVASSSSSMQQPLHVSTANDEIQCTQGTSRQIGFDQSIRISAMINQNRSNTDLGQTHNDVNNNNIRLSSSTTTESHRIDPGRYSSGRNNCSNYGRTNPIMTRDNINRTSANIPIIVGIASCVWGLFFYAVKSFYSDFT